MSLTKARLYRFGKWTHPEDSPLVDEATGISFKTPCGFTACYPNPVEDEILRGIKLKKLENYVLVLTKRLSLKKANRIVEDLKKYYAARDLKLYYTVEEEGTVRVPKKVRSHHPQCSQMVLFYRDIDEDDAELFGDELQLKRKIKGLRLYKNELITGRSAFRPKKEEG